MQRGLCIVTVLLVFFVSAINVCAEETLDLDTEDLKNKQEDYSSLTDINGINIFTDDADVLIKAKDEQEQQKWSAMENELFTQAKEAPTISLAEDLFQRPIRFDKVQGAQEETVPVTLIVVVVATLASVIVCICTKKFYAKKGAGEHEDHSNLYQSQATR